MESLSFDNFQKVVKATLPTKTEKSFSKSDSNTIVIICSGTIRGRTAAICQYEFIVGDRLNNECIGWKKLLKKNRPPTSECNCII
jgi:hypothetical protein